MTAPTTEKIGDLIVAHIRAVDQASQNDYAARERKVDELVASGKRIIDGGQTSSYYDDGTCDWEVTAWKTDEVVLSGRSDIAGYDKAVQEADPDGTWFHIDNIELPLSDTVTAGLPESLQTALRDWTENASEEDLDLVLGER